MKMKTFAMLAGALVVTAALAFCLAPLIPTDLAHEALTISMASMLAPPALMRGMVRADATNRGILAVYANASAAGVISELTQAFAAFREKQEGRLDNVEDAVDDLLRSNAAGEVGPAAGSMSNAAGKKAFAQFLRNGNPQAGMRESSDPGGGYTIPDMLDRTIQDQLLEFSPLRNWATIITLGQGAGTYSFLVNRRGASSGWVGEEQPRPETDTPQLSSISPIEGEIYANASITQWLLDDSGFDLDQFIRDNIIDEFAVQEGAAFISGNGINKPHGILTYTAVSTGDDTREFGQLQYVPSGVAGALSDGSNNGTDALINLLYSVKPAYRSGPGVGWMMNSTTAGTIRKFKDTEGRYVWTEALNAGEPSMLLGYPVAMDENMSTIGANAYPIAFGNWRRGYRIVDRMGTRVLRDPFTNKPKVMFYLTKRVGGALADSKAIKLLKVATS